MGGGYSSNTNVILASETVCRHTPELSTRLPRDSRSRVSASQQSSSVSEKFRRSRFFLDLHLVNLKR